MLDGLRRAPLLLVAAGLVAVGVAVGMLLDRDQEQRAPIAAGGGGRVDRTAEVLAAVEGGTARNVILLIGDSMADSEITIARNYAVGAAGRLALDLLPLAGDFTTYALREDDPALPDYVTDSAASATAWATGRKTSSGRLSTSAGDDRDLRTILELAQARGYRVGAVTTDEVTAATPAALASHVRDRSCQGPGEMDSCPQDRKSAGGPGSIAEQEVDHRLDLLLGGGREYFEQTIEAGPAAGETVLESARRQGYEVVTNAEELAGARQGRRLLGLFAAGDMAVEWAGEPAAPGEGSGPQRCRDGERPEGEPSLPEMTAKAIELLTRGGGGGGGGPGFFLQVESAHIDTSSHRADPCGQIGATVALDDAVREALEFAGRSGDTLVVVTGDHGGAAQIVPVEAISPGVSSVLITADDAEMRVAYATAAPGESQSHSGTQVRVAAVGPQAHNVAGFTDETELFETLARALGARGRG